MEALVTIAHRAHYRSLPPGMDAAYFASEAFRQRMCATGPQALRDRVAMVLYCLQRIAVDPREIEHTRALLARGVVSLGLFGWACPVPWLELPEGEDLDRIRAAFDSNTAGPLVDAARRVLKWRARAGAREGHEEICVQRVRQAMPWPQGSTSDDELQRALVRSAIEAKRLQVRERRNRRLAMLAAAAGPRATGWTDFLEQMARDVLSPPTRH